MEKVLENSYQAAPLDGGNTVARKAGALTVLSAGIAGGGPSGGGGSIATGQPPPSSVASVNISNGQSNTAVTPNQQIIQVSSQAGGPIVPGQQLMVQTFPGRQAIQIRAQGGQQIQQIQFIPIGSLQGQPQRQPVIIQQQSASGVLHSTVTHAPGAISQMAGLTHAGVAKLTGVHTTASKTAPVIIQQAAPTLLHTGAQAAAAAHGLHHHNVAKITTVSRAQGTAIRTTQGKMINISTAGLSAHHLNSPASGGAGSTQAASIGNATPQVARLGIISQLPASGHAGGLHAGKPILNLTTATLAGAKSAVILNPAGSVLPVGGATAAIVSSAGGLHNVAVNVTGAGGAFSGSSASYKPNTGSASSSSSNNLIPTVMTLATLTTSSAGGSGATRHTIVTTRACTGLSASGAVPAAQLINRNASAVGTSSVPSIHTSMGTILTTGGLTPNLISVSTANSIVASSSVSGSNVSTNHISQMSPLRPNILSQTNSPLQSPIKQPITQPTPSSPRPSILIRKRAAGQMGEMDAKSACTISSPAPASLSVSAVATKLNTFSGPSHISNTTNRVQSQSPLVSGIRPTEYTLQRPASKRQNEDFLSSGTSYGISNNGPSGRLDVSRGGNENSMPSVGTSASNARLSVSGDQITPRKRRKQLLEPFTLTTSQNIRLLNDELKQLNTEEAVQDADNALRRKELNSLSETSSTLANLSVRRTRPSLLSAYPVPWRPLQAHFLRHSEVRVKPEKRASLAETCANENLQKRNGWKVHHLSTQLSDLIQCELAANEQLQSMLKRYEQDREELPDVVKKAGSAPFNANIKHNSISILDKLSDLMRANTQRSTLFTDQIRETNQLLLKLANEHKERVVKLTKRCAGKRAYSTMKKPAS